MLTQTDKKIIDRALADKKSPQYQQGYDAGRRELLMLLNSNLTKEQIIAVLNGDAQAA